MTSPLDPGWTPTADLREEIKHLRAVLQEIKHATSLEMLATNHDKASGIAHALANAALADRGKE